jgi:hypothetical protein
MGGLAERSCRTPVTAKPMMMRAQTNIQRAINSSLRERLGSPILGQSLTGTRRGRYCASSFARPTAVHPLKAFSARRSARSPTNRLSWRFAVADRPF